MHGELRQVVSNLLLNSLDSVDANGKLLRPPLLQLIGKRDEEISPSLLEGLYRLAG